MFVWHFVQTSLDKVGFLSTRYFKSFSALSIVLVPLPLTKLFLRQSRWFAGGCTEVCVGRRHGPGSETGRTVKPGILWMTSCTRFKTYDDGLFGREW